MYRKAHNVGNMPPVATITDIRRENARLLARECGGLAQFARKIGRGDPYVSQLIGRHPKREIGHATARLIEQSFGKPEGWLDTSATSEAPLSDAALAFARYFEALLADDQARLLKIAEAITGRPFSS